MTSDPRAPFSRRRLLAGGLAAAATAAGGAALFAATRAGHRRKDLTLTSQPGPAPSPTPARGGVARLASPVALALDTFDALQGAEPGVLEVLGRTHSRLVTWADFAEPRLAGDLAIDWEQPDPSTLTLRLDPAARWHDRPPANGRPLTAEDVVAHLNRARSLAAAGRLPAEQRPSDYVAIRRVSSPSPGRVTIECDGPRPFLLGLLASAWALVQAPEAVERLPARPASPSAAHAVGSGPFLLDAIAADGTLTFSANPAGHRLPLLDGLTVSPPGDEAARFSTKRLDEALTRDRRDAAALRALPGVVELPRLERSPIVSTFFVGAPPWDNPALLRALSGALPRRLLAERLMGGRAVAAGPVLPLHPAFAPGPATMARFPGYGDDPDRDARDARALWAAAGGPALGPVSIDFPSTFDPLFAASAVVPAILGEALGGSFRARVDSYTAIARNVTERRYGAGNAATWFGWGPPDPDPDPSAFLIDTFHSRSSAFGYRSDAVDALLERLAREMDAGTRRQLCRDVSLRLLEDGGGGVLPWLVQRLEVFRWPYLKAAPPSAFWPHHLDAAISLVSADQSFGGRWA